MDQLATERFFDTIPTFNRFEGVADAGNYRPLPEDWLLATSDIVGSTKAIEAGRYKAVNMAGASVISALLNALGNKELPFVFGGDGALVAVPGNALEATRQALAAVQVWVSEELGLTLRAAIVPIQTIRRQGLDVRVARFQASTQVSYAMFAGGGASWAESEMKAGRFTIAPAPSGTRPDLTGLSCRWDPISARHGEIVSIIAVPAPSAPTGAFPKLVADIIDLVAKQEGGGHPIVAEELKFTFPPRGLGYEASAASAKWLRPLRKLIIVAQMTVAKICERRGWKIGSLDLDLYKSDVSDNSDFRKFDDGLKMTIDVDKEELQAIESRLKRAAAEGVCRYGLHSQDSALMTCLVASPFQRDHMHFIDGAAGGYAVAASRLKATLPA